MSDTNATAAETVSDAPQTPEAADTPAAQETTASGTHSPETGESVDAPDGAPDGDTFPRSVVEKLRKENATYRDRAKAAEQAVQALQRQAADKAITAAGLKPAAVWAVAELAQVLDDRGAIDDRKLAAAMNTARAQLGIARRTPAPGAHGFRSGSGAPQQKHNPFAAAFGPKPN